MLGGLLLAGCSREQYMPPNLRGGLIGAADVLTMSTNRLLLANQPLAREYLPSDIAPEFPTWARPTRRTRTTAAAAGRLPGLAPAG